jgi:predicted nucleotide-binding protein (sugar kinase/HSP70/actin superfamily)
LFRKRDIDAKILLPTDEESLEIGKRYSMTKEYVSLTALLGDVFSQIEGMKRKNTSIWVPKTEGSEAFGQYSRLLKQKIKLAGHENIRVESPFIEDLLEDEEYGLDFGLILIAGDLIMASDKGHRNDHLKEILNSIEAGTFNEEMLLKISKHIYKQLSKNDHGKFIYALGELSIVFNPLLNNHQLEKLELKNRVYYVPLSEMMFFRWADYLKKEKSNHKILKDNLTKMKDIINRVSQQLKEYSSFDKELDQLIKVADSKLPLYCGGNGRYRMIKQFRCPATINGALILNSMYENTGTILKLLKDGYQKEFNYPVIELSFDGSKHSGNDEKIQNFIYYI